mgnify:CR=1 FL=1
MGTWACAIVQMFFLVRASGEAIVGTQRYFSNNLLFSCCSRLRRGDFRYTTILFKAIYDLKKIRASGEAILGTQRYFSKHFTLDNITVLLSSLNFRAKFLVANHTVILFFLLQ